MCDKLPEPMGHCTRPPESLGPGMSTVGELHLSGVSACPSCVASVGHQDLLSSTPSVRIQINALDQGFIERGL